MTNNLVDGPTKCLLIQPKFSGHSFWNYLDVCKFVGAKYSAAPLGLMTVAALLPDYWDIKLVDENVEPLKEEDIAAADIVMGSGMLPQQQTLKDVISRAHAHGKPIVVGGPDPTSQPDVYKDADYRVLGEGEVTVPLFLADLRRGEAKPIYQAEERADMTRAVVPRFDLIKFSNYMHVGVQFCRGCPYNCEFCDVIELFGRRPRTKTSDQILRELEYLYELGYRGHVDFVDDNLIGNRKEVITLLSAMNDWQEKRRYPFYFSTEASLNLAKDERLLSLMQANDFRYVFIGIETPEGHILDKTSRQLEEDVTVAGAIKKISSYGMIVNGGFIVGFDNETEHTAQNMISCIQDAGICMAMVGTLYALPNTQLTRRLKAEGRLLTDGSSEVNAEDYDQTSSGLNFIPDRPTVDVLGDYVRVMEHIYEPKNYYARVTRTAANLQHKAKHRPSFKVKLKMAWAFVKISSRISMSPRVAYYYWKTFFRFFFTSPAALIATVNLAAMYVHFHKQSRFTVVNIKRRMADMMAFDKGAAYRASAG